MDYIYDFLNEDAPCRDCKNYGRGRVYDDGEEFHEFVCEGGHCIHCAEMNGFDCFELKGANEEGDEF